MTLASYLSEFDRIIRNCVCSQNEELISVEKALEDIQSQLEGLQERKKKVVIVGNGGSATIASHIVIDLWKRCGIKALSFNDSASLTCISNDYSYGEVFSKPIEMFCEEGDLLFAISSSGSSENILYAVDAAKRVSCKTVTLSGFTKSNPLRQKGDLNFFLDSDSYGLVEIGHSLILHYIVDRFLLHRERKGKEVLAAQLN